MDCMDEQSVYSQIKSLASTLTERGEMLVTAESCTGGWLAKCITDIDGSSAWFEGGVVSYSNALKQKVLGVPETVLLTEGAVSEACACAMASGAKNRLQGDWAVSITGIAGPGGGSDDKPVGTVWVGVAGPGLLQATCFLFQGGRDEVRQQTVEVALSLLLSRVSTR